jgi:hypothetical protein
MCLPACHGWAVGGAGTLARRSNLDSPYFTKGAPMSKTNVPGPQAPERNGGTAAFPFGAGDPDNPAGLLTNADAGEAAPAGPDPFDPAALRLSDAGMAGLGVKKALLSVPVRKPDKSWFVRTHPDPAYRLQTAVVELKEDRGGETDLVAPHLWPALAGESTFAPRALFTAVNRQGVPFLWPVRLPAADGRLDEWSRTALEAAGLASAGWIRVAANMALGAYDVFQATGDLPEPEWPDLPFRELLRVAFRERFIQSEDHPVLRRLRGEV